MDGGTGQGCSRYSCQKPGAFAETGYNYTASYQQNSLEDWSSILVWLSLSHHTAYNSKLNFLKKSKL